MDKVLDAEDPAYELARLINYRVDYLSERGFSFPKNEEVLDHLLCKYVASALRSFVHAIRYKSRDANYNYPNVLVFVTLGDVSVRNLLIEPVYRYGYHYEGILSLKRKSDYFRSEKKQVDLGERFGVIGFVSHNDFYNTRDCDCVGSQVSRWSGARRALYFMHSVNNYSTLIKTENEWRYFPIPLFHKGGWAHSPNYIKGDEEDEVFPIKDGVSYRQFANIRNRLWNEPLIDPHVYNWDKDSQLVWNALVKIYAEDRILQEKLAE